MRIVATIAFGIVALTHPSWAQTTLHLEGDLAGQRLLSPAVPSETNPREIAQRIPDGGAVVVGSFVSIFDVTPSPLGVVTATLHLVTGKTGMTGCAVVTITAARRRAGLDVVMASLITTTSMASRRRSTGPLVFGLVPDIAMDGVFLAGDQLVLDVVVRNTCGGSRTVILYYDAASTASRIVLEPRATATTTTTVPDGETTTTSTTTTTTTTQPPPVSCLESPASGYPLVVCALDTLQAILDALPADEFGNARRKRVLARRVRGARRRVDAAMSGARVQRNVRRAARLLDRAGEAIDTAGERGRIDPGLAGQIIDLAVIAERELRALGVLS